MALPPKKSGIDVALVMGPPKKGPPSKPAMKGPDEESEGEEDDDSALEEYAEKIGLSADEFRDAVRIAMKG